MKSWRRFCWMRWMTQNNDPRTQRREFTTESTEFTENHGDLERIGENLQHYLILLFFFLLLRALRNTIYPFLCKRQSFYAAAASLLLSACLSHCNAVMSSRSVCLT